MNQSLVLFSPRLDPTVADVGYPNRAAAFKEVVADTPVFLGRVGPWTAMAWRQEEADEPDSEDYRILAPPDFLSLKIELEEETA